MLFILLFCHANVKYAWNMNIWVLFISISAIWLPVTKQNRPVIANNTTLPFLFSLIGQYRIGYDVFCKIPFHSNLIKTNHFTDSFSVYKPNRVWIMNYSDLKNDYSIRSQSHTWNESGAVMPYAKLRHDWIITIKIRAKGKQHLNDELIKLFNGLMQERCNSTALAMELHPSCTNPLICNIDPWAHRGVIPLTLTSILGWDHKPACLPWHFQPMTRLPTWPQKALISWGRVTNCLHEGILKGP